MKVVDKKEWRKQIVCKECGSTLEIDKDDVQERTLTHFDDSVLNYYVKCGGCQTSISIPDKEVPSHVQMLAAKKYRVEQHR